LSRSLKYPTIEETMTWALKAGLTVKFFTEKTLWGNIHCCTFEARLGRNVKTYEIKKPDLESCLFQIRKDYKSIFVELSCPPMTSRNIV